MKDAFHLEMLLQVLSTEKFHFYVNHINLLNASKKLKKVEPVKDTPVIFFLKICETAGDRILPVGDVVSYSDILHSVEVSNTVQRFDNDLLKPILEKISCVTEYSEHIACFWCCHKFNGSRFVSPISYEAYKNIYTCEGNFAHQSVL